MMIARFQNIALIYRDGVLVYYVISCGGIAACHTDRLDIPLNLTLNVRGPN